MDTHTTPAPAPAFGPLSLLDLNAWLSCQLDNWVAWGESRDEAWLAWPTSNEQFPTLGTLFIHAFSPLHRYADEVAGEAPADDSHLNSAAWITVQTWARQCLNRHYEVSAALPPDSPAELVTFRTRSGRELHVTASEALAHACTHCFWHLGGIAHLLRLAFVSPPGGSDLIIWAMRARHLVENP